eukprot:s720_g8.t1
MALKLMYRSTFIDAWLQKGAPGPRQMADRPDVDECISDGSETGSRATSPARLPGTTPEMRRGLPVRSKSAPAPKGHGREESGGMSLGNLSLSALAQRAEQFHTLLRLKGKDWPSPSDPVATSVVVSLMSYEEFSEMPSPPSRRQSSCSESSTDVMSTVSGGDQDFGRSISTISSIVSNPCSLGSAGHPDLCRRPCMYFAAGKCSNGAACDYCHMNHDGRTMHLDKRQREFLSKIPNEKFLALILHYLEAKADENGFRSAAKELLQLLRGFAHLGSDEPIVLPELPTKMWSKLDYMLKKMTFQSLEIQFRQRFRRSDVGCHVSHAAKSYSMMWSGLKVEHLARPRLVSCDAPFTGLPSVHSGDGGEEVPLVPYTAFQGTEQGKLESLDHRCAVTLPAPDLRCHNVSPHGKGGMTCDGNPDEEANAEQRAMSRAVLQTFEEYQKARVTFVQTVADLATRPQNIDALQNAGVMALLRPLLLDNVASIQQSAALALGRLANFNETLAESVVTHEVLPQLVYSLAQQNRFYKKAAAFVLRAVAKHSAPLAQAVVDSGAMESLVLCLEEPPTYRTEHSDSPCYTFPQEFDPSVKESAAWALGYIAKHTKDLAQSVVNAGAVPLLVLAFQESEPDLTLKRISASALSDIAKHSPELAQLVVSNSDVGLKRQVCACLAQIAKHSVDLAEVVVEAEVFPRILHCLRDVDETLDVSDGELSRHTPDLAKLIVNAGGIAAMVDYVQEARGNARTSAATLKGSCSGRIRGLPGIMTLGYVSAFSETLALAVVVSRGIPPLKDALINEPEDWHHLVDFPDHVKAAAAWSLGQIGRHSPDHARALAEADVLRRILAVYLHRDSSEDLQMKAKRALKLGPKGRKSVIQKCAHLPALEPLLDSPPNILKYVVQQFAKVLPNDMEARKAFVQSGSLQKLQEVQAERGSKLQEMVDTINLQYPPEIVQYYSPNYAQSLLEKMEAFNPSG